MLTAKLLKQYFDSYISVNLANLRGVFAASKMPVCLDAYVNFDDAPEGVAFNDMSIEQRNALHAFVMSRTYTLRAVEGTFWDVTEWLVSNYFNSHSKNYDQVLGAVMSGVKAKQGAKAYYDNVPHHEFRKKYDFADISSYVRVYPAAVTELKKNIEATRLSKFKSQLIETVGAYAVHVEILNLRRMSVLGLASHKDFNSFKKPNLFWNTDIFPAAKMSDIQAGFSYTENDYLNFAYHVLRAVGLIEEHPSFLFYLDLVHLLNLNMRDLYQEQLASVIDTTPAQKESMRVVNSYLAQFEVLKKEADAIANVANSKMNSVQASEITALQEANAAKPAPKIIEFHPTHSW